MHPITLHADDADELSHQVQKIRDEQAPDVSFSLGHHVTDDQARDYDRHKFVTVDESGAVVGIGELVSPDWWHSQPDEHKHTSDGQRYVLRNRNGGTVLLPVVVGEKSTDLTAPPLTCTS